MRLALQAVLGCLLLAARFAAAADAPRHPVTHARHPGAGHGVGDVLWRSPGPVAALDLRAGPLPGEAPRPPYRFVKEELHGTSPKIEVTDGRGRQFRVKFGAEVHAEVFASRLVWACGYQVEPSYYVAHGRVLGVRGLGRAGRFIGPDGSFRKARFKGPRGRWDKVGSWRWDENPFLGTRELAGLKILAMLLSNWDDKDARDLRLEPNTGILLDRRNGRRLYAVTDWGSSLGAWGRLPTRWRCDEYAAQSPRLLLGTQGRTARFGVERFAEPIADGLTVEDIRWLLGRLGRIADRQLRDGLEAAGASPEEVACYARAIRGRIERLRRAAAGG